MKKSVHSSLKQMVYIYILTKRRMESRKLKRSTKNTVQKIPEDLRSTEIIKKGIALSSLKSTYFRGRRHI
jgi:hypothetical protein